MQRIGELKKLRKYFPELWEKLQYLDEQTRTDFKIGYSVKELEERFAREDRIEKLKAEIEIPLFKESCMKGEEYSTNDLEAKFNEKEAGEHARV